MSRGKHYDPGSVSPAPGHTAPTLFPGSPLATGHHHLNPLFSAAHLHNHYFGLHNPFLANSGAASHNQKSPILNRATAGE